MGCSVEVFVLLIQKALGVNSDSAIAGCLVLDKLFMLSNFIFSVVL